MNTTAITVALQLGLCLAGPANASSQPTYNRLPIGGRSTADIGQPDLLSTDGRRDAASTSPGVPAWLVAVEIADADASASQGETEKLVNSVLIDEPSAWKDPTEPTKSASEDSNRRAFSVKPYGAFWADMIYASSRTNSGPFTLFVFSDETHGEPAFTIDARRSRFGIDVAGPRIWRFHCAESRGRVEVDFFGEFVTENRADVLLRHVYWEVANDDFKFLVGQTWDVVSPLSPQSLNYSVAWNGGNIGFRRAQFRSERYLQLNSNFTLTMQISLNQDIVPDFPTDPGVRRESASWPVIEGRTALTWGHKKQIGEAPEVGISGHVGETGFDFLETGPPPLDLPPTDDVRFETWSANIDLRVPISTWWGIQGEFFTGVNLSSFLGGIGQGVCPCTRVPIRSTGGWLEMWIDWTCRLHSHIGLGIDDPRDGDIQFGRTHNRLIYANVVYDVTDKLVTGVEVASWKTLYKESRTGISPDLLGPTAPGDAVVVQWMTKYGF